MNFPSTSSSNVLKIASTEPDPVAASVTASPLGLTAVTVAVGTFAVHIALEHLLIHKPDILF